MTVAVSWRLKLSKEHFYLEVLATSEKGKKKTSQNFLTSFPLFFYFMTGELQLLSQRHDLTDLTVDLAAWVTGWTQ